ncbi:hypothetical protein ANN_13070 [Periplaneta americana]|uniref:Endonuclease/exonuclease/phosphatase domain-containing protein n=1 Tax=Periplaneta americana TaxID=6978 RepID=A0ABQ8TKH4_PERAM|nr:hypothetical protein ANN_13070 [Periplaneta americana]
MKTHFLIGGDFNSKHPRRESNTNNPRCKLLHDVIYQFTLQAIYPNESTHYPQDGSTPDLLDFFLVKNLADLCSEASVLHELSSDHLPVMIHLSINNLDAPLHPTLMKFPFNWQLYSSTLQAITETQIPLKTPKDIDIAVSMLTRNIQFAMNVACSHSQNYKNKNRVPFTPHIKQLYLIKKQCKLLWEQTKYPPYKTKINAASRELSKALRNQHQAAMESKLKSLIAEEGTLWQRTKFTIKHTDSRIPLLKVRNELFSTPEQKVKVFSEQ